MIEALLRFSVERRGLVLALVLALAAFGVWNFQHLNIDAVPDLTNTQVQITTAAPGATPQEVEATVTYVIETALAGLPGLESTRSQSRYALSQVTAVFKDGSDIYFARSLINERLQALRDELPAGLVPRLGPVATGLGEVFLYSITASAEARQPDGRPWDPAALRGLQDWVLRPQLLQVPGVSEVNTTGGWKQEFLVAPSPARMLAFGLGFDDLAQAIARNNANIGAGYVEKNGEQVLIRAPGQLGSTADLAQVVVTRRDGVPVRIADVAEVGQGQPLRTGAALIDGEEAVIGTVIMRLGENSQRVAHAAAERLDSIRTSLPKGIAVTPLYDRSVLVENTIETVRNNLLEGALLVIVVLFLMLGNIRAALITAAVIPLAMLMTISGMVSLGVSANLMSLGALDFGLIVDGAVIIVENCTRRLAQAQAAGPLSHAERVKLAHEATREVIRPSLFGVAIITLVYLPIFAFEGAEGKLFRPMAITVMLALVAALLLSLTFVPAAVAAGLRKARPEREAGLMRRLRGGYVRVLEAALRHPLPVLLSAAALVIVCGGLATKLGSEFIPSLDEGDVLIEVRRIPGTSLTQGIALERELDRALSAVPEVLRVFAGMGTTEVAIDPTAPGEGETYVMLKPRREWPDPAKPKAEVVRELKAAAATLPGTVTEFSQPVALRINELLSGVRSALAVKIYGEDLETLQRVGTQVATQLAKVDGAIDVKPEQTDGLPLLTIEPKRAVLYRYGLSVSDVQTAVGEALAGRNAGQMVQGDRRYDIVLRLPETLRTDLKALERLPIPLPGEGGGYVPLSEVATLNLGQGPNQISRENGKRRVVVTANVTGRDLGGFVADVQQRLREKLKLPAGVWLDYGGTYKQLVSANSRLQVIAPITLAAIFTLLLIAFGSVRDALLIFSGVPLALTGGVLALLVRDLPFSVTAGVGFIALSGVAILNGLVMLSFIHALRRDGRPLHEALIEGASLRLRPVLMTALVASLGFLPMALNTGLGAEVQRPLATVVIGGIISSTLLTLFVLPLLYRLVHRPRSSAAGSTPGAARSEADL